MFVRLNIYLTYHKNLAKLFHQNKKKMNVIILRKSIKKLKVHFKIFKPGFYGEKGCLLTNKLFPKEKEFSIFKERK